MERKRHIDATFDDVYSDLDGGVQSKKSHFETDDVTNQYLNGDEPEILSPNERYNINGDTNGDEDQDELDEFQFVDENPDMSEIQSSNSSHVTQSHVVSTQVVTQVVTQTDEDLAQVDEINFQNHEKSGNQCYMEMPPAKNTIHQKSEYFDDSRHGESSALAFILYWVESK